MHSLEELRVNNCNIQSISHLRALPRLRELQVPNIQYIRTLCLFYVVVVAVFFFFKISYNKLTSLDGLQMLPTIEALYAGKHLQPLTLSLLLVYMQTICRSQ